MLDGGARRAGPSECLEEQAHGLLHLLVRVEHHAPLGVMDETDGWAKAQLATARLVENAAAQAGPHHM